MTERSWSERWHRIKAEVTLCDLLADVSGKVLVALGLGALLAPALLPFAWVLVLGGLGLSLFIKAKYWTRFWS